MRIKIIRTKKNKSTSVKHTCRWHQKPSYIPSANKDYSFSCAYRRDCLIENIFFLLYSAIDQIFMVAFQNY